ncbi:iron complex transport system substrate-binding protein [Saccharopolyspora erythraea NRRL 2338]|uniref:Iron ABC transporter substrate-binding protein n=2 Tax=Saccharopolyspora erythraea TaxID=1836 RepID=A4FLK3_SACEN|nr:ABC transporter substrate-binding protein [Saccharopolyspora erythraea]EQD82975.1 ABC transporter substrate-binding protein [Saccharopolyspora erythraea D]PFG98568.1 iron complex transport system substrate-binding protein [Saccharopolyspora erythraea NRRL 2338]QRK88607.1 ABC transporter substrate-binding protein [Saccharopolyspora erythraea]CAM04928.1 putative iron ABC transporter substrate-binding protein [Saccharopolyspora erythraea NRRL 2338]
MTGFRRLAALLLAALALLAGATACATRPPAADPPGPVDDPASAFPAKVQIPGQEPVTLPQQPKRIVSLSPTATETLYAVGAGDQVVAVDQFSDFPAQAPRTELSALNSDAAAIGGQNPDLVIAPDNATELAEGLRALDVPVLLTPAPASLDDAYRQIEVIGQATGHTKAAKDLAGRMRSDIERLVESTPKPPRPLTYYHEVSPDHYTATSQSFVGSVYARFGLINIADPAGGPFPQLSEEHIVQANPDLIFLADTKCCQVTAAAVAARPGWNALTAVREGRVVELDDDTAGRWGPRVVDLVRSISEAVKKTQHG